MKTSLDLKNLVTYLYKQNNNLFDFLVAMNQQPEFENTPDIVKETLFYFAQDIVESIKLSAM